MKSFVKKIKDSDHRGHALKKHFDAETVDGLL